MRMTTSTDTISSTATHPSSDSDYGDTQNTSTSSSGTSTGIVSLLSRLRSPTPSDLRRKRNIASNPPIGKRRSCGTIGNEPKNIQPYQHIKEFPGEHLKVNHKKLFCEACRKN